MNLKKCSPEDAEKLAELNKHLIKDEKSDNKMSLCELQDRMKSFLETDYTAYLFMEDNRIIGYALVNTRAEPLYLRQFFIARNFRRNHKGRRAFELLLDELKTDKIDLEVLSWNEAGLKFWQSCGFAERSRYMRFSR
ncbi:MAG: GNAT family N-acetyltransferase [Spirochaetaceae bacterium]|nr:GNAT family N-acetyltransferase [Spirochaetaceae bacterium]